MTAEFFPAITDRGYSFMIELLALASAVLYGSADFFGGLTARRANTIAPVIVTQVSPASTQELNFLRLFTAACKDCTFRPMTSPENLSHENSSPYGNEESGNVIGFNKSGQ